MRLILKVANTGIVLDPSIDDKRATGTLFGIPYRVSVGSEMDVLRSSMITNDKTGWDYLYELVSTRYSAHNNKMRIGVPVDDGIKEFHLNPGLHGIVGPTATGKSYTMMKGVKPFVERNPLRSIATYTYSEDRVEGGVKLNNPEELFVEIASDVLDQLSSFCSFKDAPEVDATSMTLKQNSKWSEYVIDKLNDNYSDMDDFMSKIDMTSPLPKVVFLDSIRDFVYSKGISGSGGFNMRVLVEIGFMKGLFEDLNMHYFVAINPLVSLKEKDALDKIESDADSSTSAVFSMRPSTARSVTPEMRVYARGPANPDRGMTSIVVRNLKDNPVTETELKEFMIGNVVDVAPEVSVAEEPPITDSLAVEDVVTSPTRANKSYGTKIAKPNEQDMLLSALLHISNNNNSEFEDK